MCDITLRIAIVAFAIVVFAVVLGVLIAHWIMWLFGWFTRVIKQTFLVLRSEFLGNGKYKIERLPDEDT